MSALESSVTLEDVFSVVEGKRVPLAPELAGYLTLEIADGSQATGGEVDPRTVYISEEGTVALVRPKKDMPLGDAETSVRGILAKLLEASGSATPALSASAKRKPGAGLPSLISELEAALIPVNRAAGRRALARLAREVKRVTLGVGRNASVPPPAKGPGSRPIPKDSPADVMTGPDAPPGPRASVPEFIDEALTAKRTNQVADLASLMNDSSIVGVGSGGAAPKPFTMPPGLTPPPLPGAPTAPTAPPPLATANTASPAPPPVPRAPPPVPVRPAGGLPPPPIRAGGPVVGPPPRAKTPPPPAGVAAAAAAAAAAEAKAEVDKLFGGDEVDSLLSTFEVSNVGDKQVRNDLKAIAGLDPTPAPPDPVTLAELTKDVGKDLPRRERVEGDSVEALLALADSSGPIAAQPPMTPAPPPPAAEPAAPMPVVAAAAMEAALKRPVTPRAPNRPVPAPAPSATGRQKKFDPAPAAAAPAMTSTSRRVKAAAGTGNFRQPRAPRTGMAMLILTVLVLVAGGIAVWMFKPAFFTGKKKPTPTASVSAAPAVPAAPRCKVALVVSDVPANAEILLRMGQAPLDVERMPVGTRLEFVATAEGYAPRRAVIKAESPWDKAPDGKPRIDVPIQLDPTKAKAGTVDPWPVAEPGSQVGGSGSPGTVHVVSNVRGAEVWLLAGLGPEARIEQLRCDADIDVLLAGPPQLRKRLHVGEKEIQAATADPQGNRVVSVSGK